MLTKFKNSIKTSRIFWKYRHLIDKNVWHGYFNDYHSTRRNFYSSLVSEQKYSSVFEFGCASPNLANIRYRCSGTVYLVGHDINRAAISLAEKNLSDPNTQFIYSLSDAKLIECLKSKCLNGFDLAIYDRVLYLLSIEEIYEHLQVFSKYFRNVIIDDFHKEKEPQNNGAYYTKDYIQIFEKYGFALEDISASEHNVATKFFRKNAKRIWLRNTQVS